MCYEEAPAVPQPAYIFTGFSLPMPYTSLTESLPEYQTEDPFKTDQPPPSYIDICSEATTTQEQLVSTASRREQELRSFANMETSDTQRLIAGDEENSISCNG